MQNDVIFEVRWHMHVLSFGKILEQRMILPLCACHWRTVILWRFLTSVHRGMYTAINTDRCLRVLSSVVKWNAAETFCRNQQCERDHWIQVKRPLPKVLNRWVFFRCDPLMQRDCRGKIFIQGCTVRERNYQRLNCRNPWQSEISREST